jgi:hypothetical protein
VPIPRKMEIGNPGKILFLDNPDIVIPVPIIIAIAVKNITIILFVCISALDVSIL